jgi:uncharacterized YkwD family protein
LTHKKTHLSKNKRGEVIKNMKKKIAILSFVMMMMLSTTAFAQPFTYSVKQGECIWKIAQKYGCQPKDITKLNPQVKNPRVVKPGQKVSVPSTQDTANAYEKEVIRLTNVERKKAGLPALTANAQASKVARMKSQDMATKNYFSHQSPTHGSPFQMMQSFGLRFSSAGENIAYGQKTPQEVVNSWMRSPGHKANILSRSYTNIGVGLARNKSGVPYWTQMFLTPSK